MSQRPRFARSRRDFLRAHVVFNLPAFVERSGDRGSEVICHVNKDRNGTCLLLRRYSSPRCSLQAPTGSRIHKSHTGCPYPAPSFPKCTPAAGSRLRRHIPTPPHSAGIRRPRAESPGVQGDLDSRAYFAGLCLHHGSSPTACIHETASLASWPHQALVHGEHEGAETVILGQGLSWNDPPHHGRLDDCVTGLTALPA
jgi:hypothetical protein